RGQTRTASRACLSYYSPVVSRSCRVWTQPHSLTGLGGSMLPKRIGIDLGTANVLVYVKGRGIVINEPSVVALANRDNTVVAVGREAQEMMGRVPGSISVIRPMRDGVIADYLITEAMLRYFIQKVIGRLNVVKPEVMVCIPAGVTSVEERAVRDAAEEV